MPPHAHARPSPDAVAVPPHASRRWRTLAHGLTATIALAAVLLALHLGTTGPASTPSGGPSGAGPVAEGAHR